MKALLWDTYEILHTLDAFGSYWLETEKLIDKAASVAEEENRPDWIPKTDEDFAEYSMHIRYARELYDDIMTPMFRYSCIVMLYTIAERELHRLVDNLEKHKGTQGWKLIQIRPSTFLSQISKFTEVFFPQPLSHCPQYQSLTDLQKVRDCIVHCQGEIDRVRGDRKREYLRGLKHVGSGVSLRGQPAIEISSDCIAHFIRELWAFFTWAFAQLAWEIDDCWIANDWGSSRPSDGSSAPSMGVGGFNP